MARGHIAQLLLNRDYLPTGADERLTFRTLLDNAASAGAGLQTLVFPALTIAPDADDGPTPVAIKYGDVMFTGHSFAASGDTQYSHWNIPMPGGWDPAEGMDFAVHWTAQSGSGGVAFATQCFAAPDGGSIGGFFSNERIVTDTLLAPYDWHTSAFSSSFTDVGASTGDTIFMRIKRVTDNAADTLAQPAILIAVTVRYRVMSGSDD